MRAISRMRALSRGVAMLLTAVIVLAGTPGAWGANHREAPITALDHKADITDFFAFVSYGGTQRPNTPPSKVTLILDVDPLLSPTNGPNYFPFDPEILYAIKVDNNHDGLEDITFEVRFTTEFRLPGVFTAFVGAGDGVRAPGNSPDPIAPGSPIIPPGITALDGVGSEGINLRQRYTVTMVKGRGPTAQRIDLTGGRALFAVPSNVGPRTMDYGALFRQGTYTLPSGVRIFAGTVDDPFWIDLGATFDSLNFRATVAPGVLSAAQDAAAVNVAPDAVSGFNVNAIAIEVPIAMLTKTGFVHGKNDPEATLGTWGTTSRPRTKVLPSQPGGASTLSKNFTQIQRMANPLVNELLIGTAFKDRFSMSEPKDDSQFADFLLDPFLARAVNAATGGALAIPAPPRFDLLPLVQYAAPICGGPCSPGPIADLLRLNTGVPATPPANASRLGLLGGDPAGFPNGRRVFDDVTDIALRVVVGGVLVTPPFPGFNPNLSGRLGDGVNVNDKPYRNEFPYVADAHSGRDSRHIDPGEPGCTAGAGAPCPVN